MTLSRLSCLFPALVLTAGCAAKPPPAARPDAVTSPLEAARAAVKEAEAARAKEQAPVAYRAAIDYLREAEKGSGATARDAAIRAETSARLAAAEAGRATADPARSGRREPERVLTDLQELRDENRRLEERLALTQQTLEQTETELIRSKARLKGTETKAEATSAIAEARILLRRLRARSPAATLCQESLAKAEQQLAGDNHGAAVFFALKAQDIANRALAGAPR